MTRTAAALLALTLTAPQLAAQEGMALTPDRVHGDSLGAAEVDTFTLDLEADRFVLGEAEQRSVDVVIRVFGPDGEQMASVDITARGTETFRFDTEAAGRHRIEVSSFEEESGAYAVAIRRVEPVTADPAARVDQLMAAYDRDDVPGGAIGVVRGGELVFARGYGMANLAYGVPFEPDTRNNIGSTSKQFTAFAILLLAERGELSLDDDVRTHLPELPDFGHTVTLRHFLTHTSGYREFLNAFALAGRRLDEGDHIGRHEIVALVERQPELQNVPGAEFNYNNTGFALLTLVVERVTGTPFPEWMRANVFGPLGMEHTMVRAHPGRIVPDGSQGYMPQDHAAWRQAEDLGGAMGAGGIYATIPDLARWMANFSEQRVGAPGIFDRMTTRNVLTDGDTTDYGLGLFVDEYRGLERVHHGGADIAHRSMLVYYPELDAGVLAQSNNATFNSGAMANDVARAFFGEHMEQPGEEDEDVADGTDAADTAFDPAAYDPEDFDDLAGRYAMAAMPSFVIRFFREGDTLWSQATGQPRVRIEPTSDSTFRPIGIDARIAFHVNPDGTADSLTLYQNGEHRAHRLEAGAWEPTAEELTAYTGRYFSAELETFYTLALEEDRLVVRHRRLEDPVELSAAGEPDTFTGGFPAAEVEFLRGDAGEVMALEVSNGRTRGVRFERVEPDAR